MRAWVVRGGRRGRFEDAALKEGVIILGWEEIPDISALAEYGAVRRLVEETYPGKSAYVIGNWAGQLWRFRGEIAVGDLLVLPRLGKRLAIGRVAGEYEWRAVANLPPAHVRAVDWLRPDVPRSEAQSDLRDSLGSLLTVYELRRNNAAERINSLSQGHPDPGAPGVDDPVAVFGSAEDLLAAAAARESDDPIVLPVRDLLNLWGAHRRGSVVVEQIQRDLAETGLTTKPPFNDGDINSSVAIVPLDVDPDEVEPEAAAAAVEAALPPISYLVGNLTSATAQVLSARADDPLAEVIDLMRKNNYSQVPVIQHSGGLAGAVTWASAASALQVGDAPLRAIDAVTHSPCARSTDPLLTKVKDISDFGYVFVVDSETHVIGIVTSADLASQFSNRVEPFILTEEVEQRLRRILDRALGAGRLSLETVREILGDKKEKIEAAKDLTLGQYRPLFEEVWDCLDLKIGQEFFLNWLYEAKEFRNNLMHFSPDPLAASDLVAVQGFRDLLEALDRTA